MQPPAAIVLLVPGLAGSRVDRNSKPPFRPYLRRPRSSRASHASVRRPFAQANVQHLARVRAVSRGSGDSRMAVEQGGPAGSISCVVSLLQQ